MELGGLGDSRDLRHAFGHLHPGCVYDYAFALAVFFQQQFQHGDVGGAETIHAGLGAEQLGLVPGTGTLVAETDDRHLFAAQGHAGLLRHARDHQGFTCTGRTGQHMYAAVRHSHMGLLHRVAQLTTDLVHGRFNLFKALNTVYQQGTQGHRDGGFLQSIAQRVQIA